MSDLLKNLSRNAGAQALLTRFVVDHRGPIQKGLNLLALLLALAAATSLVAVHGFFLTTEQERLAEILNIAVLCGFILLTLLRFVVAPRWWVHLKAHWVDATIALLGFAVLAFPGYLGDVFRSWYPLLTAEKLTNLYLVATQSLLLLAFIPGAIRYSKRLMTLNIQPSLLIVLSFFTLILAGTGGLMLPRATVTGSIASLDALFTAASAACVTGLTVVDTGTTFSPLGQTIILLLMQVGGLGIMTLTTFFAALMGSGQGLKEYATLQSLLGEENVGGIRRTAVQIAVVATTFELAGAAVLFRSLEGGSFASVGERVFFSLFHAVSAFCNAGFALTRENLAHPFLKTNTGVLCTIMVLIVVGGIGFPVLRNIGGLLRVGRRTSVRPRLTLHTRLVLITTAMLLLGGALLFGLLESGNTLRGETPAQTVLHALFQSVTARTAGFNTVDIGALAAPAAFVLMVLMWVGASPGSTGGGVKTTTLALALLNIRAIAQGKQNVEIFRKKVAADSVTRAFSTALLSLMFIMAALFLLLLLESASFQNLLFEVVSALGTVGLSAGITPSLSAAGKVVIVMTMFAGRVGLLSIVMAVTPRGIHQRVDYTQEIVLVT